MKTTPNSFADAVKLKGPLLPMIPIHRLCLHHHGMHDAYAKGPLLRISPKPLPFRHMGPFDRVLVAGIPVWQCPSCHKIFQDLELLVTIEDVLERHVSQGDVRPFYFFSDLAS